MRLMPNVALIDIVALVMSGSGVAGEICKECPETKVLISTQCDEPEDTIVAEKTGAYGFIPKKAAGYDLITGMRTVDAGKYFPASFAEVSKNQRSGMGRFAGL